MKSKWQIVFLKELRETLRDKRSLGLLLLFTLMYPVMLGIILNQSIKRATKPEREGIELAVIGAAQAPNLMAQLKQKNVLVKQVAPMSEEAITELLQARKVVALLRITDKFAENYEAMRPARVELWFDSASDNDKRQRDIEEVIRNYSSSVTGARLLAHGVSPVLVQPVLLQRYDTGSTAARSAGLIGSILGLLFFPAFICGLSAAVDSTAGERERRSLEVLMSQPARAWELVVGKWMAAASLSLVGVTVALLLAHGILTWLPLEEIGMSWRVTTADLAKVILASIPLSLFAAAIQVAVAMNAKSFKEAQSMLSFLMLLPLLPGMVVSMMEVKTATWMYLVPILSNQTLLREIAKGEDIGSLPYVLTFFSALLPALAAAGFASWRMKSERYVLGV
ncbi:ABC transporter permease subunit [Massilia sp. R2A-15]|uniref:ABC transporter permease n=1 Tax=Massilia sp. R2A-15 TaxID=3064278 RepID=UPI002734D132|nr:ABC transporter permease [Massilia sp. R2A-15]WLI89733.1 ABC transporter permease subunit [Massilia sp. R2A-15]